MWPKYGSSYGHMIVDGQTCGRVVGRFSCPGEVKALYQLLSGPWGLFFFTRSSVNSHTQSYQCRDIFISLLYRLHHNSPIRSAYSSEHEYSFIDTTVTVRILFIMFSIQGCKYRQCRHCGGTWAIGGGTVERTENRPTNLTSEIHCSKKNFKMVWFDVYETKTKSVLVMKLSLNFKKCLK